MKKFYYKLITFCCFLFASTTAFAQPGVLDVSFGNRGKVTSIIPDSSHALGETRSMIIQPDGKIITAAVTKIGTQNMLMLVRRHANGSIDNSFGNQGAVFSSDSITPPFNTMRPEVSLALQADGKILYTRTIVDFVVRRFNTNGTPDSTFGTNSVTQTNIWSDPDPIFTNSLDQSMAVRVRPNGKIVVGGNNMALSWTYPIQRVPVGVFVMQYNTNGLLDSTFGTNGIGYFRTYDTMNEKFRPVAMEIQPDQKIVLAGSYVDSATNASTFGVIRFNADGTIDSTFGIGGLSKTLIRGSDNYCNSMTLQADNKIVLAGYTAGLTGGTYNIALLRLLPSGIADSAFGTAGKVITSLCSQDDFAQTVQIQADGKILVGAITNHAYSGLYQNAGNFALIRYHADGTLDTTYGRKGMVATDFLNADLPYSCVIQPDGKVLLAGVGDYRNQRLFAMARYEPMAMSKYNTLEGIVFFDKNANAVKDAGEPLFTNATISVVKPNVDTSITNTSSGSFSIDVDSGRYITSVVPYRPYFTVVPASYTSVHGNYFNTDNLSFALKPIPGKRDLAVDAVSLWGNKPGFNSLYYIHYYNNGTDTVANASVQFIKNSKHTFNSAFPAPSSINGDTLHWIIASLNPQVSGDISVSFTLQPPPSANIGDTIIVQASISSNATDLTPNDNFSLKKEIARGAFDPNDKTENHGGKINHVKAISGEYLTYTIRFQNTGNDTAFNVYIRDTMDSKLDWNSLQIVASSHNYKMTMNDGKCLITFPFIMLVDSIKNEPKSHGYIVYKIKTKPNVQIGDVIKNRAAIYFDYNLPIITNTETTNIVADVLPLRLLSFTAKKQDKANLLNWSTTNEVNVDRFEVERSNNAREFYKIGTVKAGQTQYSFTDEKPATRSTNYYRLKMIDRDGQFSYSHVRLISNNSNFTVAVYPNPAKDNLQVQIEGDKNTGLQLLVLSADGKIMLSKKVSANESSSLQNINISTLLKGSYLLKVIATKGDKEESVMKFEKL